MVVLYFADFFVAFHKELIIVKVAVIARNSVIPTHIYCLCHFLSRHKCLVELFTATDVTFSIIAFEIPVALIE